MGVLAVAVAMAVGGGALLPEAAAADQPNMRSALQHLEQAEKALEKADGNKGGHRAEALKLVRKAQEEVRKGIKAGKESRKN